MSWGQVFGTVFGVVVPALAASGCVVADCGAANDWVQGVEARRNAGGDPTVEVTASHPILGCREPGGRAWIEVLGTGVLVRLPIASEELGGPDPVFQGGDSVDGTGWEYADVDVHVLLRWGGTGLDGRTVEVEVTEGDDRTTIDCLESIAGIPSCEVR